MPEHKSMTYQQTLDYLFEQLPMFQRVGPMAFKKDLGNILQLCEALGNPQDNFRSIHIAGTNGKGSTAHMISAVMQQHGYKTGLYTSPHYRDFRERIKLNDQLINEDMVIHFVEEYQHLFEKIQPSFFEITVAMAFWYFAEMNVDIAIIETGLGGRLDSTNIIHPEMSIITNISYDHQQFLGETLEEIAGEKAGIIKSGVPVVIGEEQEACVNVFLNKAELMNAPISFASQYYTVELDKQEGEYSFYTVESADGTLSIPIQLDLRGPYQGKNLCTVLHSLDILDQSAKWFVLDFDSLWEALQNIRKLSKLIGRWQILQKSPLVIADSAHNVAGMWAVTEELQRIPHDHIHIVFGMVNDKESQKILKLLPKDAIYYFAKANIPRGLDAQLLQQQADNVGLKGNVYPSVSKAYKMALANATEKDLVFIGGSIFVVAEVV